MICHIIKCLSSLIVEEERKGAQSRSWAGSGWNKLQNPSETRDAWCSIVSLDRYIIIAITLFSSSLQLCERSTSPQWNESYYFLVHDPKHQMLVVKVRHLFTFILQLMFNSSDVGVNFSFLSLCIAVVQRLGPANGISGGDYEWAASRATAGPGPVVPSGWSRTWESDPAEGWAQGDEHIRPHAHTHIL